MPVKDVYGKEVSRETHMKFAYNPTSALLNELKNKKMSDREIMEAKGYGKRDSWMYKDTAVRIPKVQHHPDARKHQIISFIKSGVRILGYGLIPFNLVYATLVLIFSEVIGIIEELV